MVKEPRAGRVKTRLGAGIGMTNAAWWFRHQSRALLRRLDDPRWQIVLAVSPDREGLCSRFWPSQLLRVAQGGGDLGQRMARILFGFRHSPTIIIGADIPAIQKHHIERAFAALGQSDVVIGPAKDGGFWLIGMKRAIGRRRAQFGDVRWSTGDAMADTLATLSGANVAFIDTLNDVDTAADL